MQRLKLIGILILTIFLLFLVIRRVGLEELKDTIIKADFAWVLLSLCLAPLITFTGVIKWKILLSAQGIQVSLWRLYGLYLVGGFFNNFLPSNVGGDVVRGYELNNYIKDGAAAMASVFMERLTGFITLIIIALISFFSQISFIQDIRLMIAMAIAVIGLISGMWLILDSRPLAYIANHLKFPLLMKIIPKLQRFQSSLLAYRIKKRALALSMFWSIVFISLAIINVYVSARAFHQPVPFLGVVLILPIILVVAMVPITFNGIGIQEWAYVLLFTFIGLPPSVGLSTIILIRGKAYLMSIIGGIIYAFMRISRNSAIPKLGN